jgi:hypothetical protein
MGMIPLQICPGVKPEITSRYLKKKMETYHRVQPVSSPSSEQERDK